MKTLWHRITLQCYCHPDEQPGPWYAWPLAALFVVGWLAAQIILSDGGY